MISTVGKVYSGLLRLLVLGVLASGLGIFSLKRMANSAREKVQSGLTELPRIKGH